MITNNNIKYTITISIFILKYLYVMLLYTITILRVKASRCRHTGTGQYCSVLLKYAYVTIYYVKFAIGEISFQYIGSWCGSLVSIIIIINKKSNTWDVCYSIMWKLPNWLDKMWLILRLLPRIVDRILFVSENRSVLILFLKSFTTTDATRPVNNP